MPDDPENLTEAQLEAMLLDATSGDTSGRQAMARVTALRTVLRGRVRRRSVEAEQNARRALELVNATRGPDAHLSEIHPTWVASILAEPEWAALYASDEEMAAMAQFDAARSAIRSNGKLEELDADVHRRVA